MLTRSSPAFGLTLAAYELLQRLFHIDFGGRELSGSRSAVVEAAAGEGRSSNPDHIGGYQVAAPVFAGIQTKFGICLPRFQSRGVTGEK